MKNNAYIKFLRKWTDRLELMAILTVVVTEVVIVCFILSWVVVEHSNRQQQFDLRASGAASVSQDDLSEHPSFHA